MKEKIYTKEEYDKIINWIKYFVIKEYPKLDLNIFNQLKEYIKHHKEFIPTRNYSDLPKIFSNEFINKLFEKLNNNFTNNFEWLIVSKDKAMEYLMTEYIITVWAYVKYNEFSCEEASIKAIYDLYILDGGKLSFEEYLNKIIFINKDKNTKIGKTEDAGYKEILVKGYDYTTKGIPSFYLAIQYLKQLGFDKNKLKDREIYEKIREKTKKVEETMKELKLTKEEFIKEYGKFHQTFWL